MELWKKYLIEAESAGDLAQVTSDVCNKLQGLSFEDQKSLFKGILISPSINSSGKSVFVDRAMEFVATDGSIECMRAFCAALEGLIEYEAQLAKLWTAICSSPSATPADRSAFLDLPVETFFTIPHNDRVALFKRQLSFALASKEYQKAGYILKKVDLSKVDNSVKMDFVLSQLTVNVINAEYGKAYHLSKEHESLAPARQLLGTLGRYLSGLTGQAFLDQFDEKHFLSLDELQKIMLPFGELFTKLNVLQKLTDDFKISAAKHNFAILKRHYTTITHDKFSAVCLSLLPNMPMDSLTAYFSGLIIDEPLKQLKFSSQPVDTLGSAQSCFSLLSEIRRH